jgi:hypothetical protein
VLKKEWRKMTRVTNDQIERYLGTFPINYFESKKEIQDYFSRKSLSEMFGDIDLDDAKEVENAVLEKWQKLPTHFVVKVSAANMPGTCWGTYKRIAVLECEHWQDEPKMISTHARGVVRIVETWERLNVGITERCAFRRALADAEDMCRHLNAA